MAVLPHDLVDLYLAPVTLRVDERLKELGELDVSELTARVAIETNAFLTTRGQREQALLLAVGHLLELHGWQLAWHRRGVELRNGEHTLVLGAPPVFDTFMAAAD